jgi:hypothetical protein
MQVDNSPLSDIRMITTRYRPNYLFLPESKAAIDSAVNRSSDPSGFV